MPAPDYSSRDRDMILNPRKWRMTVLPLKRKNFFEPGNTAVFTLPLSITSLRDDEPIEIRIGTMFDNLSELPTKTYSNVDALLADGWRVD